MQKQTRAVSKSQAVAGDFPYMKFPMFVALLNLQFFFLFQAEENDKHLSWTGMEQIFRGSEVAPTMEE